MAAATDEGEIAASHRAARRRCQHRLKPDVTAPGWGSSRPSQDHDGTWTRSTAPAAAPHVAGAAAVLRQRHPAWTPAQIKSALATTGTPVTGENGVVPTTRQGGGMTSRLADNLLVFAAPSGLSFGLLNVEDRSRGASLGRGRRRRRLERRWRISRAAGQAGSPPADGERARALAITANALAGAREARRPATSCSGAATRHAGSRTGSASRRSISHAIGTARTGMHGHDAPGELRSSTRTATRTTHGRLDPGGARRAEQVFQVSVRRQVAELGVRILSRSGGRPSSQGSSRPETSTSSRPRPCCQLNVNPYFGQLLHAHARRRCTAARNRLVRRRVRLAHSRRRRPIPLPLLAQRHDAAERTPARPRGRARRTASTSPRRSRLGGLARFRPRRSTKEPPGSCTPRGGRSSPSARSATESTVSSSAPPTARRRNHENVYRILPNTRSCVRRSASADPPGRGGCARRSHHRENASAAREGGS